MIKKIVAFGSAFAPFLASAAFTGTSGFVTSLGSIIGTLTPIVFALALLYFFWGLAQFILASGDAEKASEGKSKMIWGVVALFVMSTVFGLITFIQTELGINASQTTTIPRVLP